MTLRLLVADDHEIIRRGLRALLEAQPGWAVTAEAIDGRDAIEKAEQIRPDVAILDVSMPTLNGLEATRQIVKKVPRTRVVVLTVHDSFPLIGQVLAAGAQGYILKSDAGRDLVTAVEAVSHNKTFFTSKVAQMVLEGYLNTNGEGNTTVEGDSFPLTNRQKEVLQLVTEGKSSKEVACALGLSVKTAETHRANIMHRLDCHSVTELVRFAVRNHIIEA
jgi:DNA-binding NarL/FixJ family response regulator